MTNSFLFLAAITSFYITCHSIYNLVDEICEDYRSYKKILIYPWEILQLIIAIISFNICIKCCIKLII